MADSLYHRLAGIPLQIEALDLESAEQATAGGWVRRSTTVVLRGRGCEGRGEDVTYSNDEQDAFARAGAPDLRGSHPSFDAYSRSLDANELAFFSTPPEQPSSRLYRRWAFESAGLDLALRQAQTSIGEALDRPVRPVRYVASTGLGSPPSIAPLDSLLTTYPDLQLKIDYDQGFTDELLAQLAELDIACVDFKGHYHGSFSGPPVDPERYAAVARALPNALLEDPGLAGLDALSAAADRLSWDYPVRSVADILLLPPTRWLNIKPSRFGLVSELLRAIELAEARGIGMYGGGQFELGVGRGQAQLIAAMFYAEGPNDLAPSALNEKPVPAGLPGSPMALDQGPGFGRSD